MNDEGQDSKPVYSFAQIDFALLKLLFTQTFVLLRSQLKYYYT